MDDAVGAPVVMQIIPNMLPVSIASVSLEGADVRELTDFVDETLLPKLEGIDGVASVSVSGAVEETVAVTIDEERIELLNSLILREVDDELADVEAQLSSAQSQISEGKRLLAREKSNALGQIDDAQNQLSDDSLGGSHRQAQAQRETLQTQLAQTEAAIAAMEALTSLTPEQQAQLDALNAQLAALRTQRETKQAELEALQGAVTDPAAQAQYEEALARREELLEQRASLETYIEEQKLRDPEALRGGSTRWTRRSGPTGMRLRRWTAKSPPWTDRRMRCTRVEELRRRSPRRRPRPCLTVPPSQPARLRTPPRTITSRDPTDGFDDSDNFRDPTASSPPAKRRSRRSSPLPP